jgi:hypothetical protein
VLQGNDKGGDRTEKTLTSHTCVTRVFKSFANSSSSLFIASFNALELIQSERAKRSKEDDQLIA